MEKRMFYTAADLATEFNVTRPTIYNYLRKGYLGYIRVGGKGLEGGKIVIPKEAIDKFIKERTIYQGRSAEKLSVGEQSRIANKMEHVRASLGTTGRKRGRPRKAKEPVPGIEGGEETIHSLRLRRRTLNVLYRNGYITIASCDFVENPELQAELAQLAGFGLSCFRDLQQALYRYHHKKAEDEHATLSQ